MGCVGLGMVERGAQGGEGCGGGGGGGGWGGRISVAGGLEKIQGTGFGKIGLSHVGSMVLAFFTDSA